MPSQYIYNCKIKNKTKLAQNGKSQSTGLVLSFKCQNNFFVQESSLN